MVEEKNLIDTFYNENSNDMKVQQLAKRVILAPTNKNTLEMNRKIIAKLPRISHIYTSSDSLISEDPNDVLNLNFYMK